MRIINLIENMEGVSGLQAEHGLSFYIETPNHKILVDAGATGAFAENAEKLGIDLRQVDTVVLSHGHYDHSGGLETFAEINSRAPIYLRAGAVGDFYHVKEDEQRYIGISDKVKNLPQNVFVDGDMQIDEELSLFTNVKGRRCWPSGNLELKKREKLEMTENCAGTEADGGTESMQEFVYIQDDFSHEQYLVISAEGEEILISGCAHNGILNILDRYRELYGRNPGKVISGFHMRKKKGLAEEDISEIRRTAEELANMSTLFYTGHCTGMDAYGIMKEVMGEQLKYVRCGEEI